MIDSGEPTTDFESIDHEQKVRTLMNALTSHFNTPDRMQKYQNNMGGYPLANDYGLRQSYDEALDHIPSPSPNTLRVALIVGNGAVFSATPEFQRAGFDLLINLDYTPGTVHYLDTEKKTIQKAHTTKEAQIPGSVEDIMELTWMMGDRHYNSSPARLAQVQKSLEDLDEVAILADLTKKEDIDALIRILTDANADLVLCNFTNALEVPENRDTLAPLQTVMHTTDTVIHSTSASGLGAAGAISHAPIPFDTYIHGDPDQELDEEGQRAHYLESLETN